MTPAEMAATHEAAFAHGRSWTAPEFAALLANPHAFACGHARCFAVGQVVADEAELLTIATHPAHRRRGLARACMDMWQAQAARRGADRAFLEVAADNTPALGLYRRCGFARAGLRRGYYRRPGTHAVDAIVMQRILP